MDEDRTVSHGCIFCKNGKERDVVRHLETVLPGSRAIVPTRSRYRRVKNITVEEHVELLPGYVFFEVCEDDFDDLEGELRGFSRADGVLKFLRYTDGRWQLYGYDDQFARMLFATGGNIGFSKAYFDVGRRIKILSGFLKDYEGSIVRVNRKAMTVVVDIDLQGKKLNMQLGYELVEPINVKDKSEAIRTLATSEVVGGKCK